MLKNLTETTLVKAKSIIQTAIKCLRSFDLNIETYFKLQISELEKMIAKSTSYNKEINILSYIKNPLCDSSFQHHILKIKNKIYGLYYNINMVSNKIIGYLPKFKDYYKKNILDFNGNANLDKHLYYFKAGTKTFVQFDLDELLEKTCNINANENQGSLAAACQVPSNKLFYYGGYCPHLNTTYLIDLKTFHVEVLNKSRKRSLTAATYFKGSVYIFGGQSGKECINACSKYDLIQEEWIDLAKCPFKVSCISVLPYLEFFILTGQGVNALFNYNLLGDTYKKLPVSVIVEYSLLLKDERVAYFITKDNLYMSDEKEATIWLLIKKKLSMNCIQHSSKPVKRN